MKKDCIFCKIVKKEIPVKIIEESENFIAIPDKNPKVDGHALIISKKHFINILDMPALLGDELLSLIKKIALKYKSDFNIVVNTGKEAGQIIFHFHLHLIPRSRDDGFRMAF